MEQEKYKYFAFISYNSHDTEWGKRVQKKLEGYRMPATLCSEYGWERTPIKPVFFAPTDIQPGGLNFELQNRLKASRHLIVICSPNSAKSKWVGKEIEFFHSLGRTRNIHFFIVDGVPHSGDPDTECFNPVIDKLKLPEILGANIHEQVYRWPWLNKERAFVQLITKLLGVEFDSLWQRHKRMLIKKAISWGVGINVIFAALIGTWVANQPIDVNLTMKEATVHNYNLPPLKDAVVTITLDNESKSDTIKEINTKATFVNVPHHFIGKKINVKFNCKDWNSIDTTLVLDKDISINIYRNTTVYGSVHFKLWNITTESPVSDCKVWINDIETSSDRSGMVNLSIPLSKQKSKYRIKANANLENNEINMPCGKDDIVIVY